LRAAILFCAFTVMESLPVMIAQIYSGMRHRATTLQVMP
jgi:hypothetical protein